MAYIEEEIELLKSNQEKLKAEMQATNLLNAKLMNALTTLTVVLLDIVDVENIDKKIEHNPNPEGKATLVKPEIHRTFTRGPRVQHESTDVPVLQRPTSEPITVADADKHIKSFGWKPQGGSKYDAAKIGIYQVTTIYKKGKNSQWVLVLFKNTSTGSFFTAPGSSTIYRANELGLEGLLDILRKFEKSRPLTNVQG